MVGHIRAREAAVKNADDVLHLLQVTAETGLTGMQAIHRQHQLGYNEFADCVPEPLWRKYFEQFSEPMIVLLLCSAGVSLIMRQYDDAISITAAIVLVVTVAFIQGYRSEKAIEALKKLMPPKCSCLRGGKLSTLFARDLVPGDIVYLSVGDRVPADLRLIEANDLYIDESSLTGETKPRVKQAHALLSHAFSTSLLNPQSGNGDIPLQQRRNHSSNNLSDDATVINMEHTDLISMDPAAASLLANRTRESHDLTDIGFMGTLVRSGTAIGVVIATGGHSEFGEVVRMMQSEHAPRTPLQKSMDRLGKHLSVISLVIIVGIVLIGLIQRRHVLELFTIGVSLAVAAIPEGLPIVVTVTLAIGQMRMAARNAIVKKLPAVETLGCVNVICSDKTGTMTKNEMTITQIVTAGMEKANVTGVGYLAHGDVWIDDPMGSPTSSPISAGLGDGCHPNIRRLIEIGCLCNNAVLVDGRLCGQPTEGALLCVAAKLQIIDARQTCTRLKEWPFSSENKMMSVKVKPNNVQVENSTCYFFKGAPDQLLRRCGSYRNRIRFSSYSTLTNTHRTLLPGPVETLTDEVANSILGETRRMGSCGLRVLALAEGHSDCLGEDGEWKNLIFAGLVGLTDPPRPDVESAIGTLSLSGVRVVMITGDSRETACAIGARLHLYRPGDLCLSGNEVEVMDLTKLRECVHGVTVFYRTGPRHKVKIVKAFQERGLVVAMTGDGVNDAVALKSADIGVAMGKSGTDVCKEAADLVLIDDNFTTILAAMEEGKALFHNICNFVRFQLSTSIAALTLVALSTLLSLPNPLNAMQILYINILMDGPPAQSLGVEPPDPEVVCQPPRRVQDSILDRRLIVNVLISATTIVCGTLWIFYREMSVDRLTPRDTTMTFTCFVLFDMFNALSCRSQKKSIFVIGFFTNRMFVMAVGFSLMGQVLVVYVPLLQTIFQTEALYLEDWLLLICLSSSVFVISELRKMGLSIRQVRCIFQTSTYRSLLSKWRPSKPESGCTV